MKAKILTTLFMLIAVTCFGKKKYTMSKSDFINQFAAHPSGKVYCTDENGNKVWLYYNNNTQLALSLKDNSTKLLLLHTVGYNKDTIEGIEYNVWVTGKKISSFNIGDVQSFTIVRKSQEGEMPYFNLDSCRTVAKYKNDSLRKEYTTGSEWVIDLVRNNNSKMDTLPIMSDACYHINFKDGNSVKFGVVENITEDSIYISSHISIEMAIALKEKYTAYAYLISEISALSLLRSGGFSAKNITLEDFEISVRRVDKSTIGVRSWYAVSSGEVKFYRSWLVDGGFKGVTETNGRAIWYEGEYTQ